MGAATASLSTERNLVLLSGVKTPTWAQTRRISPFVTSSGFVMDSMNRTCCTWLTGEQEPRQPGFRSWRGMHCIYVKLPSEGCWDFFFFRTLYLFFCFSFLSVFFFFLAYFSVNHLLITYSLGRPNAELVAPPECREFIWQPTMKWFDFDARKRWTGSSPHLVD